VDQEDDFVCFFDPDNGTKERPLGTWGTGKNTGKVGTMSLYQYGEDSSEMIYICEVGTGLTDKQRGEMTDPELYPLVAEVRFQARKFISEGAKSNALTHPRIVRFREDKGTPECFNDKLTSSAS
jgi:ATP-dependent DNA ligase